MHAELTLGLGIGVGYNQVELLMSRAGTEGLPGVKRARPRQGRRPIKPFSARLVHLTRPESTAYDAVATARPAQFRRIEQEAISFPQAAARLVLIDTPDVLFSKFEHLGVYGRAEVERAADASGHAMALRFSDTEIFPKPVTLRRLTSLARGRGLTWSPGSLISLSKISSELFQAVYQEGHRTT